MLSLVAVPIYLHRLGLEAMGMIGFFISLQAVLQILDLGLGPAINREVARANALGERDRVKILLRTLSRIYWSVGLLLAAALSAAAPFIASHWFNAARSGSVNYTAVIALMGALIGIRWPIAVYQNALIGLGRLATASVINIVSSSFSFALAVGAITLIAPKLELLFIAQLIGAAATVTAFAVVGWVAAGGRDGAKFNLTILQTIWRFSAGMTGVTLTGLALTQLDKVLLVKMLPLADFGRYMVGVNIAGIIAILLTPLVNVIFPRLSGLVAAGRGDEVRHLYDEGSRLFAAAYLPVVMALGIYARDLVALWTGNAVLAEQLAPMIAFFCIGWGINGLMYFPYSLQLAYGLSQVPLAINAVLLMLFVPLVFVLTRFYGGLGGAIAWAVLQCVYLFAGCLVTHRLLPVGSAMRWIWRSVLIPIGISAGLMATLWPVVTMASGGGIARLALIVVATLITQAVCGLLLRLPQSFAYLRQRNPQVGALS